MKYIINYAIFENDNISVFIKDVLADLSDDGFSIAIEHPINTINPELKILQVFIDKIGQTDKGYYRGKPFTIKDIESNIDNLISMLSSEYDIYSVSVSNTRSESIERKSGTKDKSWNDPWLYIRERVGFELKWFSIKFTRKTSS